VPTSAVAANRLATRFSPVTGSVGPLAVVAWGVVVVVVAALVPVLPVEPEDPEPLEPEPPPVCEGVVEVGEASTTTVPCMNGWIVQTYGNVPAWVNVCDALCPFCRVPVSKLWSFAVAVCAVGPLLVHVIVSPTWIVIEAGENLKSEIVSPGSPATWALWSP
jgi:hypothetical protein